MACSKRVPISHGITRDRAWNATQLLLSLLLLPPAHVFAQTPPTFTPPAAPAAPTAPAPPTQPAPPSAPPPALAGSEGSADDSAQPPAGDSATGTESLLFTNDRPRELWSAEKQDAFHSASDEKEASVIDMVEAEVVSASNQAESSLTAPAWIISLSQQDLRNRGYVELTELLDDLPSMDITRPFGTTYVASYFRGYRSGGNSPFLLMIDGSIINSIWANSTTVFGAIPLSSIDHVEIVYGPASAVYGPNAAMGVINVITNRGAAEQGLSTEVRLTASVASSPALKNITKIADTSVRYHGDGLRVLGSARLEFGVLDPTIGENFEWTRDQYYRSSHWGRFARLSGVGEGFRSQDRKAAATMRLMLGRHVACGDRDVAVGHGHCSEIALEHYQQTTGQGSVYPAPLSQTTPTWTFLEQAVHFRHIHDLSHAVVSDSRIRFRNSNIEPESQTLFYESVAFEDDVIQVLGGSRLGADASAWVATQDFAVTLGQNLLLPRDRLSFKVGARYQHVTLDHDLIYTDAFVEVDGEPLVSDDLNRVLHPESVDSRSNIDMAGAYLLGFYSVADTHFLNAGCRFDYSQSLRSLEPTLRAGYVGRLTSEFTVKLLYGQAFQEPTMNELLNAESSTGTGDADTTTPDIEVLCTDCVNGTLRPESSQTFELSAIYASHYIAVRLGGYYVTYHDAMVPDENNFIRNADSRTVVGGDASMQLLLPLWEGADLNAWLYYSLIARAEETDVDKADGSTRRVGDLSKHKVRAGLTLQAGEHLSITVLGRFTGKRVTVNSNPLNVGGVTTLDANINFDDLFVRGLSLGVRGTNLLGTTYFHPGINDASSGQDPASFTSDYLWLAGAHNSLLPQPGREFFITLSMRY